MDQDIVCAFVVADCSLSDEDVCEDISECVHAECAAFFGCEQARQHGGHVEKVVHSFRPKSELEIKKRREHVEHGKRNSTCRTCGRKGHWAGDQICPNFVGNRSAPGSSTRPWNANWSRDVSKTGFVSEILNQPYGNWFPAKFRSEKLDVKKLYQEKECGNVLRSTCSQALHR